MSKDLHQFLDSVSARNPGLLERVSTAIDPNRFETIAYLKHLDQRGEERMVLFDNIPALDGEPSAYPLFYNAFVTRALCAAALDMDADQAGMALSREVGRREQLSGSPESVTAAEAPVKQFIQRGEEADLRRLPVAMHHQDDVGPYLTMTCAMRDIDGGFYDITYTKNRIYDSRRMSFSAHRHHHLEQMTREYEKRGQRAPVIVILGHHPAFFLSTCCLTPFGNDDYHTASAFLDEPLRLVPSETWGDEFMVPADAELIIEGEIPPGERDSQNPFGEILGFYQPKMQVPVIEVTAISGRRNAIVQDCWPGHKEHWNLGGLPKEGSVYNAVRKNVHGVRAVHLPGSGCGRLICYISLKKEFSNDPSKAAMQAFVEMPNLKLCIIVDEDVDVYNEREVMWAVSTRTHWDRDLTVIPNVQSFRGWLGHAVTMIDATEPADAGYSPRNRVPEEALERIKHLFE